MTSIAPRAVYGVAVPVVSVEPICRAHVWITVEADVFPSSGPGQFLQLRCAEMGTRASRALTWRPGDVPALADRAFQSRTAFLRRPFSIADRVEVSGKVRLAVISRNIGPGTAWLDSLRPGDALDITGPLGTGFTLPAADETAVLIGGGVGIPPLIYLARELVERSQSRVLAIFGATSRAFFPLRLLGEPRADGIPGECVDLPGGAVPAIVTTDDGTLGMRGRVTDALRGWAAAQQGNRGAVRVYACGPDAMLRAVAQLTRSLGYACSLCIERPMGCGLGTCLSCVVRVDEGGRQRWALTCTEGPAFERDRLCAYRDPE